MVSGSDSASATISHERMFVPLPTSVEQLARVAVIAYALLVLALSSYSHSDAASTVARLLSFFIYLAVVTSAITSRKIGGGGFLSPLFFFSPINLLRGVIPSTEVQAFGLLSHRALPGMSTTQLSYLVAEVNLLQATAWGAMILGYYSARNNKRVGIWFSDAPHLLRFALPIAYILGWGALFQLVQAAGGITPYLHNITAGFAATEWETESNLITLYSSMTFLTVLGPCIWLLRSKRAATNGLFWVSAIGAVACVFLANGRRTSILQATLAFVTCWMLQRRSIPLSRLLAIAIALFLMVGLVGELRRQNWKRGREFNTEAVESFNLTSNLVLSWKSVSNLSAVGAIYPIVAKVPEREPFLYGRNYFDYLNRFIPRFLWPEKPRGIGIECAEIFYGRYGGGGFPPGALGEAYWSGGLLAIVIVFAIWGRIVAWIARVFVANRTSAVASLLYLLTITTLWPSEPSFRRWLFLALPLVIIMLASGMMRRQPFPTESNS